MTDIETLFTEPNPSNCCRAKTVEILGPRKVIVFFEKQSIPSSEMTRWVDTIENFSDVKKEF